MRYGPSANFFIDGRKLKRRFPILIMKLNQHDASSGFWLQQMQANGILASSWTKTAELHQKSVVHLPFFADQTIVEKLPLLDGRLGIEFETHTETKQISIATDADKSLSGSLNEAAAD